MAEGRPLALSERLAEIAADAGDDRISFSELARQLHSRVWGGLLLIFAAINVMPLPPGTSTIIALPILLVSAQMVFGRPAPWFPRRLDQRGVTKEELQRLVDKMGWFEARVERVLKPRLPQLTGAAAMRVIGSACFLLGLVAALPILMIHNAPALAIVLFGLGLIYRDGILVIIAAVAAVFALLFDAALVIWGVAALKFALAWLKG
ncbi:hypothetical protein ACUXST_000969 [Sphingomonas sp. F9_3S_D5_B_2]